MRDNTNLLASVKNCFLISNPYALRPNWAAANKVEPLPAHGSITTSPLSVKISMSLRSKGTRLLCRMNLRGIIVCSPIEAVEYHSSVIIELGELIPVQQ